MVILTYYLLLTKQYFFIFTILKINQMKKLFLLATAALLVSGVTFANNTDKGKKKKCAKGKSCCNKAKACDKKAETAEKTAEMSN
jgi:hypothetical protein